MIVVLETTCVTRSCFPDACASVNGYWPGACARERRVASEHKISVHFSSVQLSDGWPNLALKRPPKLRCESLPEGGRQHRKEAHNL
jgi:hypothetical protein